MDFEIKLLDQVPPLHYTVVEPEYPAPSDAEVRLLNTLGIADESSGLTISQQGGGAWLKKMLAWMREPSLRPRHLDDINPDNFRPHHAGALFGRLAEGLLMALALHEPLRTPEWDASIAGLLLRWYHRLSGVVEGWSPSRLAATVGGLALTQFGASGQLARKRKSHEPVSLVDHLMFDASIVERLPRLMEWLADIFYLAEPSPADEAECTWTVVVPSLGDRRRFGAYMPPTERIVLVPGASLAVCSLLHLLGCQRGFCGYRTHTAQMMMAASAHFPQVAGLLPHGVDMLQPADIDPHTVRLLFRRLFLAAVLSTSLSAWEDEGASLVLWLHRWLLASRWSRPNMLRELQAIRYDNPRGGTALGLLHLSRLPHVTLYLVALGLDPTSPSDKSGIRPPGAAAARINPVHVRGCPAQTAQHSLETYRIDTDGMSPRRHKFIWSLTVHLRRCWNNSLALRTGVDHVPGAAARLHTSVMGAGAYTTDARGGAADILKAPHPLGLGQWYGHRIRAPKSGPEAEAEAESESKEGTVCTMTPEVAVAVGHEIIQALQQTQNYFPQMLGIILSMVGELVHPVGSVLMDAGDDREDTRMPSADLVGTVLHHMPRPDMVIALADYRVAVAD